MIYKIDFALLLLLVLSCITIGLNLLNHKWLVRNREQLIVWMLGVTLAVLLAALFHNTPFGLNSYNADQHYILASITKFAFEWKWTDFAYANLASYYPPLYFYALGKLSWLLHVPPYLTVKWGVILGVVLLAPILFRVWSPLIGARTALIFTTVFILGTPLDYVYKPYEFATAAFFLPWWLYFGERLLPAMWATRKRTTLSWIIGIVSGAVIFQTYYYWFFIAICYIALSFLWSSIRDKSIKNAVQQVLPSVLLICGVVMLSGFYWIPVFYDFVTVGYENYQNRWFSPGMLAIHVFDAFTRINLYSVLVVIGLFYLVWTFKRSSLHCALMKLNFACFSWYALGFAGVLIGMPNLYSKTWLLHDEILLVSFSLFLNNMFDYDVIRLHSRRIVAFALCLFISALGQSYVKTITASPLYSTSMRITQPPSNLQQLRNIPDVSGKVFLTDQYDLVCFAPIYLFLDSNPNYANPAARHKQRANFLRSLSKVTDDRALAWLLQHNKFDKIDYIWLQRASLSVGEDRFPNGTRYVNIAFPIAYQHSIFFTKIGSTGIYKLEWVKEEQYSTFDLYSLAIAVEYAKQPLSHDARSLLLDRIRTTRDSSVLRSILEIEVDPIVKTFFWPFLKCVGIPKYGYEGRTHFPFLDHPSIILVEEPPFVVGARSWQEDPPPWRRGPL